MAGVEVAGLLNRPPPKGAAGVAEVAAGADVVVAVPGVADAVGLEANKPVLGVAEGVDD